MKNMENLPKDYEMKECECGAEVSVWTFEDGTKGFLSHYTEYPKPCQSKSLLAESR